MSEVKLAVKGRGAIDNPTGRFEKFDIETDPDEDAPHQLKTQLFKDTTREILSYNDSPDIGLNVMLNPYRGCEHGCIYCYARPTHEYLGFSAGLDFETKIMVKKDAPELLRKTLSSKSWKPQVIGFSGVTDSYQPIERKLQLTRRCMEVLAEFRNPVVIITKNHLVTRDIDILAKLAEHNAVRVFLSITTLDKELARLMEPRASRPDLRLDAVKQLRIAGISTGVMIAPIIPGLTDHEIPAIFERIAEAGAQAVGRTIIRLPYGVKDLFKDWLNEHYEMRMDKILNRIRDARGGKLYDADFSTRMRGTGEYIDTIEKLFQINRKKFGLDKRLLPLSIDAFRNVGNKQFSLF